MIKPSVEYIDYSHLYFRKRTGVVWGSFEVQWMYWEGCGCFGYDACQKKRFRVSSGSGSMSHTRQRLWGWATWFNTMWRAWHINQFRNIICHKWRCILQPNSWLKALLVVPIRAVFSYLTRPTCQIARLIHTERMYQYNQKYRLETCYFQAYWCRETSCDWIYIVLMMENIR